MEAAEADEMKDEDLKPYNLVLYSSNDPRKKANAALLMALYVVRGDLIRSHLPCLWY